MLIGEGMGTNESRQGSSSAHTVENGRWYAETLKESERLYMRFEKQSSMEERGKAAILEVENGEEGGRGDDLEEVVVRDDGSKDGEQRKRDVVVREEGSFKEGSEKEKEVVWVEDVKDVEEERVWSGEENQDIPCYPQRSNVKDCTFYLLTGTCAYKSNCRFNHPPDKKNNKNSSKNATNHKGKKKVSESAEQQKCKNVSENVTKGMANKKVPETAEQQKSKNLSENATKGVGKNKVLKSAEQQKCKNVSENATKGVGKNKVLKSAEQQKCKNVLENATKGVGKNKVLKSAEQQKCKNVSENATKGIRKKKVPESAEQQKCKYYLSPTGCRSSSCKFRHQPEGYGSESVELNFMGLPIRHGEQKCPSYMHTGSCKISINCRYHHPEPTEAGGSDSFSDALPSYVSHVPTTLNLQPHLQGNDYEMTEHSQVPGQSTYYYPENRVTDFPTYHHSGNLASDTSASLPSPTGLLRRPYSLHGTFQVGRTRMYEHSDLDSLD